MSEQNGGGGGMGGGLTLKMLEVILGNPSPGLSRSYLGQ